MRVYRFSVVEGQEWILPCAPDVFDTLLALDGREQVSWRPPRMELLKSDAAGRLLNRSDFPWHGYHAPFIRAEAAATLRCELERWGELLPVECAEPVWLYNVTTVIDALDLSATRIVHFDDGSIMDIEAHAFRAASIGTSEVFKLPMRSSATYATESFVDRIERAGLSRLSFELVWRDDGQRTSKVVSANATK